MTAVANGDLKRKLTVEAKGEIAVAETINGMTDTLATFADQVTTVARRSASKQARRPGEGAGRRGHLEGPHGERQRARRQPDDAGASDRRGRDRGDAGRPDALDHGRDAGRGRVPEGHDQRDDPQPQDTTQKNTEQDWLKTNLAKFSRMLQGQKDLVTVGQLILSAGAGGRRPAGRVHVLSTVNDRPQLRLFASYASGGQPTHGKVVSLGEGLVGRAIDRRILLTNVPSAAFRVASGLSENAAMDVMVLPVVFEGEVRGVLELASLRRFNPVHEAFLARSPNRSASSSTRSRPTPAPRTC